METWGKIMDQTPPSRGVSNEKSQDNKEELVSEKERVEAHLKLCRG